MKKHFSRAVLFGLLSAVSVSSVARDFPNRPIHMVIPFAAGGGADIVGRLIAEQASQRIGQPIVIENRAGASGNIGASHVARSAPDGYTLLFTGPNHSTNISLYSSLTYHPLDDFEPVSLLTVAPYILVSNPDSPLRSVKDLINIARDKPDSVAYGSAGNGTAGHLAMELLKTSANIDMLHVPYKGSAPMLNDLVGGRVMVGFDNVLSSTPFIQSNRLRAIGISTSRRTPSLPEVPPIAESGLPGFDVTVWQGLLAPAGTPQDVVKVLHESFVAALKSPEVTQRLAAMSIEMDGGSPEAFRAYLEQDIAKWAEVIKNSGARVD